MPNKFRLRKKNRRARKRNKNPAKNFLFEGAETDETQPQSFVIHQGEISSRLNHLVRDFKRVMKPHTAERLKARKRNKLSDFAEMSSPMKVSHLIIFTHSDLGVNMKISRLPQGPTLNFRVVNYGLTSDVLTTLKKQMTYGTQFSHAPCLMTNLQLNEGDKHLQLCAEMFLGLFPTIKPAQIKLKNLRRCCLLNYDAETTTFDFRHYSIRTRPLGISKAVNKLLGNKVPNLQNLAQVSDFVVKSDLLSESEGEDDPSNQVDFKKSDVNGKISLTKSSIRLAEIGPRLTLKLIKIEDGLCCGTVLYHRYHSKTPEELLEIEKKKEAFMKLKEKRRKEQTENVKRKEEEKKKHKQKCLDGMKSKKSDADGVDDDADYFRDETGEDPEEDVFRKQPKRKQRPEQKGKFKRRKTDK